MTVTSNIHIGVPAWATGRTYAVGDRVTNVGNAYRCIAPGVSVGGPGGTASDITDGTVHWRWISAVDFTSLTAWWASIPSTLTQPVVGVLDYFSAILATAGAAFVGDALFNGSIGRTDLPGGDFATLENAIRTQIYTLSDATAVYPGHGPATTVGDEKESNPYVRG